MMGEILKKISKHTLIYGAGNICNRIIGFLMIPIYTHFLTPRDYGIIELLDLTGYVLGAIIGAGMGSAILRYYYESSEQKQRNEVISTALLFACCAGLGCLLILLGCSQQISVLVFQTAGYGRYLSLVFVTLIFGLINEIAFAYLRAKQQSLLYTALSTMQLAVGLSFNIYLIVFRHLGIWGVLYSGIFASGIIAVIQATIAFSQVGINFSFKKLTAMLSYGAPLIPASMGMFVLTFADRFFLQRYAPLSAVGIYSLAYRLGMVVNALVTSPFLLFWTAYMYEVAARENAKELFARIQVYLTLVLVFIGLALSIFAPELLRILAPPEYRSAAQIVPVLALSYVILGLNYFFHLGILLEKKTSYLAYAVGGSALLNLLLNFLLIPRYHAAGAAWATLLSFCAMTVVNYNLSNRLYSVRYEHTRLIKMALIGVFLFVASKSFPSISFSVIVVENTLLLISFPFLLKILYFYRRDELEMVRDFKSVVMRRLWIAIYGSRVD